MKKEEKDEKGREGNRRRSDAKAGKGSQLRKGTHRKKGEGVREAVGAMDNKNSWSHAMSFRNGKERQRRDAILGQREGRTKVRKIGGEREKERERTDKVVRDPKMESERE